MNVFLIQMFMEEQMKLFKPDGHLRPASFPSQDGVQGQNGEAQPLGWVCSSGLWRPSMSLQVVLTSIRSARVPTFSKTVQGVFLGGTSCTVMSWPGSLWPQRQPRKQSYPTWWCPIAVQADWHRFSSVFMNGAVKQVTSHWSQKGLCPCWDLLYGARKAGNIQTAPPESHQVLIGLEYLLTFLFLFSAPNWP